MQNAKCKITNYKLKIGLLFLAGIVFLSSFAFSQQWKTLKGKHFIIYFTGERGFSQEVLRRAEKYYRRIADDLGYQRYSNFWSWDKRVKIYIYPDRHSYLRASDQSPWSMGMADYTNKSILSFEGSPGFLDRILPHELTHLIFRDYVGFKGEVPLWLDEGVAMWEEEGKRQSARRIVKILLQNNKLIDLKTLTSLDIRGTKDNNLVSTFYIEAISLVGFLIERYGAKHFINFCRELRDGKSLNEALGFTYPDSLPDMESLEKKWVEYINGLKD